MLLANLLGLELHDLALERYVKVGARLSPILTLTISILTLVATLTIPIVTLAPTRTLPYTAVSSSRCTALHTVCPTHPLPPPPPPAPRLPLRTRGESRTTRVRAAHAPPPARGARPPAVQEASGSAHGRSRSRGAAGCHPLAPRPPRILTRSLSSLSTESGGLEACFRMFRVCACRGRLMSHVHGHVHSIQSNLVQGTSRLSL